MKRAVVLLSGKGSNLPSLIAEAKDYTLTAVFSDKIEAPGLERARSAGLTVSSFPRQHYSTLHEQKSALYAAIESLSPDLVLLAGYMQLIREDFALANFGKILNIHPSLLPAYPGLDTYRRALEDKVQVHGCSVHLVDAGLDSGPLLAQASCKIDHDETEESLQEKVFLLEKKLYPAIVNAYARNDFSVSGKRVLVRHEAKLELEELEFQIYGEEI